MKKGLKCIFLICMAAFFLCGCVKEEKKEKKVLSSENTIFLQMRLPDSLNPLEVKNISVRDAFLLCYEPLFTLGETLEPEGVLAENIQIADDSQSAIITLKEGVLWHDGESFTSNDVIYTINLLKENQDLQYYDCVKYIEDAQSIDKHSLKLILSRPYGQIAYSLNFPIVASHNDKLSEKVIGTGPYRLEKYVVSSKMEMKSFESWHGGQALCSHVVVSVIRDRETATSAFNSGVINATTSESFDLQNSTIKANSRSTTYPSNAYEFIAFNHKKEIFSKQAVRSAISSAIDRSIVASEGYLGAAEAANSPINPAAKNMASSVLSQYNLANSHEMLFFEGYTMDESTHVLKNEKGEKFSFTLLVNSDNQNRVRTGELLRAQLCEAGIEVNIREEEFEKYTEAIKNSDFDAYLGGTRIGNLYDFEFLFSQDGALNNYGYKSDYMNLALAALASSSSKDALSNAVSNFEEVFTREVPICGLVFCKDTLITGEKIMGKLLPESGNPYKNISGWSVKS